jgi:hypothetical protein
VGCLGICLPYFAAVADFLCWPFCSETAHFQIVAATHFIRASLLGGGGASFCCGPYLPKISPFLVFVWSFFGLLWPFSSLIVGGGRKYVFGLIYSEIAHFQIVTATHFIRASLLCCGPYSTLFFGGSRKHVFGLIYSEIAHFQIVTATHISFAHHRLRQRCFDPKKGTGEQRAQAAGALGVSCRGRSPSTGADVATSEGRLAHWLELVCSELHFAWRAENTKIKDIFLGARGGKLGKIGKLGHP